MVISDLVKPRPNAELIAWARSTDLDLAFLSAISVEEIELGIQLKQRKDPAQSERLRRWFDGVLEQFAGHILPFDAETAQRAAKLHSDRTRPANDARIAATALQHKLTLVTRNTKDFEGIPLRLLNPYTPGSP
jgi:predicted nucleic acid-binding protein